MFKAIIRDTTINMVVFESINGDNDYYEIVESISDFLYDNTDYIEDEYFNNMLDECHESIRIGDCTYQPSLVLERTDPLEYTIARDDYKDFLIDDAIYELKLEVINSPVYCGNLKIIIIED